MVYNFWFHYIYTCFQTHWTAFDEAAFGPESFFGYIIETALPNLFHLDSL